MAPFGNAAGSASALLGTIQYALGVSAGELMGMFHNGTEVPMTATMAVCGLVGWWAVVNTSSSSALTARVS
jgi:DHA1 family bicyclomycin/chloramphenicol resistance-like MFS transporter